MQGTFGFPVFVKMFAKVGFEDLYFFALFFYMHCHSLHPTA